MKSDDDAVKSDDAMKPDDTVKSDDDVVKSDDDDAVKSDDDAVKWGVGTAARVMINRLAERHLLTMYAMLRFLHKIYR